MNNNMQAVANNIITTIEDQLDEEIQKLENLDIRSLEQLREQRLLEMKKEVSQRDEWISKGHGEYSEIEEKEFFSAGKASSEMIVHFYKSDVPRCKIFDHHLKILAVSHPEARFVKINAEKAPFLAERLNIKIIPTLMIAIDNKIRDYVIGFTDLGNKDDFSTEVLEWRLGVSGVIKYEGDISKPSTATDKKKKINRITKRTIREKDSSDSENSD